MSFERFLKGVQIVLVLIIYLASLFAVFSYSQYLNSHHIEVKVIHTGKVKLIPNANKTKSFKVDISNAPLKAKRQKPAIITI